MATDTREVGLRIGASFNQASNLVTALINGGQIDGSDYGNVISTVDAIASGLLEKMNAAQGIQVTQAAFPGTTVTTAAPQTTVNTTPAPSAAAPSGSINPKYGYDTTPSGSSKPLYLAEHPELPEWLHAQCRAVGVDKVWDNRGKANFVAAISKGLEKTPPPFRSATDGVDKSFWAPDR